MTGRRPSLYWRVSWQVVSPLLLLGILLSYVVLLAHKPLTYKAWNPQYVGLPCMMVGAWSPGRGLAG